MRIPRAIRNNYKAIFDGVFIALCLWIAAGYYHDARWFFGTAWVGLAALTAIGWTIRNYRAKAIHKIEYDLPTDGLVAMANLIQDEDMRGWWTAHEDEEFNETMGIKEVPSGTYMLIKMEN